MKIHRVPESRQQRRQAAQTKQQPGPSFNVGMVGTAWCVAEGKYFVTANHVLMNGTAPRDVNDKFFVFIVPENGTPAFHFPVTGFLLEDSKHDVAVFEIALTPRVPDQPLAAPLPISLRTIDDGVPVITCGFPSPQIFQGAVDQDGTWHGGSMFLKSHANTGIVAAHYELDGFEVYEFNVGWHHGESGGPVCTAEPVAAFSMMQQYRNVTSPHGVVAGPHRGVSLSVIEPLLRELGAMIIS
jgi:hypothetical protein